MHFALSPSILPVTMITFQEMVAKLNEFWARQGCLIVQPYDAEKGAGTFNPSTFLRCLGPEPFRTAYIEPCRRPKDGRYGTNPNRLQHYFQYQVILKPSPYNIQDLYLQSLEAVGLPLNRHDIRFVHDDWESPTLGAWGLGWEVWIDGQECSQFTYFQSVAGQALKPITGEITYGIERLAMYLQNVDSIFDIQWSDELTYGDLYQRNEVEWSHYNFEESDSKMLFSHFEDYEKEAKRLVAKKLPIPAYDFVIKASHAFNLLDARGAISVTERASYIANIRDIAKTVAECYVESRQAQGFPLIKKLTLPAQSMSVPERAPHRAHTAPENFVLEIGCEELPHTFVESGANNLKKAVEKILQEEGIAYSSIKAMGTPRRLALFIEALAPNKPAVKTEKKGPSVEHAFDQDGLPKPAAEGFFRSLNLASKKLSEIPSDSISIRDGYLYADIVKPGIETIDLLEKKLPLAILSIDFPKKMRWADLDITFARPIRWAVAIYGDDPLHFALGPIHSSNISMGHRMLANGPCIIASADTYVDTLRGNHVLVDIEERRKSIEEQLHHIENAHALTALSKEKVIGQVLHLVEYPFLTVAHFDKAFLRAPKEVLISEMVEHQKYFPLADSQGQLIDQFVITANTKPTDSIRKGNQKVISARLSDGVFLYEQDLKTPLKSYLEKLKNTTFQKGLGTVYEKAERLQKHAETLADYIPGANRKLLKEAALLSKADLASEMVGEFPDLQGVMGRIYAEKQGKDMEVAIAIDEHWMPRGEKAPLPTTTTGTVLSLADKIDNLLGFFALDLKPTSSSDPYALRRAALGIIRILIQMKIHLPLEAVLRKCFMALPEGLQKNQESLIKEIVAFMATRAKTVLLDYGFSKGEIEACAHTSQDDFYDLFLRIKALHEFRKKNSSFDQLIEVHKRCKGQLNGAKTRFTVQTVLLQENEEKELHGAFETRLEPFTAALSKKNYTMACSLLAELQPSLAALFEKVKILHDDTKIRENRLALLQDVAELFEQVADFQKIQEK